jgi:hypothetical protein
MFKKMAPSSKLLKRAWSRKWGDSVPTVPTPWPHDFVLGQGAEHSLSYEDLDIYQWQQGVCTIIENSQHNIPVLLSMISHMKYIFQLAQYYGWESAK